MVEPCLDLGRIRAEPIFGISARDVGAPKWARGDRSVEQDRGFHDSMRVQKLESLVIVDLRRLRHPTCGLFQELCPLNRISKLIRESDEDPWVFGIDRMCFVQKFLR